MSKTRIERILTCADRNETVTPNTLRRWFRVTQDYKREFDSTVVRSARYAIEKGLLRRPTFVQNGQKVQAAGEYQITAAGKKYLTEAGIF